MAGRLESLGHGVELAIVRTTGDRLQDAPIGEAGGKRLFVKDLEDALLRREIDLAVHSAKDIPADIPEGLSIAAALPREDPRDALVLGPDAPGASRADAAAILAWLASRSHPRIGTSSVRRVAQLAPVIPNALFAPMRGNVDTRLRKLDAGEFDAIVLACAGLRRLGLESRISAALPVERCLPAPGQGIIVVQARADDAATLEALRRIHDDEAGAALAAERALVEALGGDCQIPLGALARLNGGGIELDALVCSLDGGTVIRRHTRGPAGEPGRVGRRLADELTTAGATALIEAARRGRLGAY